MKLTQKDRIYVGDTTYIDTDEGYFYLAIYIDLYSDDVVGFATGPCLTPQLVCAALRMAIKNRNPPSGLIVHSDRAVQYTSHAYQQFLTEHGFISSMCIFESAVCEAFLVSAKQSYHTKEEAHQAIGRLIQGV